MTARILARTSSATQFAADALIYALFKLNRTPAGKWSDRFWTTR